VSAQRELDVSKLLSEFDNGKITGNTYENRLLGFRLKFPSSMKLDKQEEIESLAKEGLDLIRNGRSGNEERIAEMLQKERMVFALSIPPRKGSAGASLILNIKKDETGEEMGPMIERSITFFTEGGKFKVAKPAAVENFGGLQTTTFTLYVDVEGGQVYSKSHVARRNGYLLNFAVGYAEEKDLAKIHALLKAIELF
jgi:hypothetical protein